jgi:hypothetical protein
MLSSAVAIDDETLRRQVLDEAALLGVELLGGNDAGPQNQGPTT